MATDRSNAYYQQLEYFDQKANPQAPGDNTQIQKVAAPTDSANLADNGVTVTVSQRPFTYGVAQYAQSEYGG